MPRVGARNEDAEVLADPEVQAVSSPARSGPLVVEIEYRVAQENARAFHNVMQDVQLSRQRNGAYGWSIARDIADPELWTERYHCPTWLDYLRQRNRATQSERALHQQAIAFPHRPRSGAHPPHAGAAVRLGALEGRDAGPRRQARCCRWSRPRREAARRVLRVRTRRALLPVIRQHLVAGFARARAVLLQAGEHGAIAIVHHGAAKRVTSRAQASWPGCCCADAPDAHRTKKQ